MPRQLWVADRCREFGLKVVEVAGWQTRGRESFSPVGVMCHHTADGPGEIPSLRILVNGRSDLPGPLCQVGLGRSGTCYIVASGVANHGGRGEWNGVSGNSKFFGIEAENRGGAGDPWPLEQLHAYHVLCAALITGPGVGGDFGMVCGHKEYALPKGRKPDPHTLDMDVFRAAVRAAAEGDEMTDEEFDKHMMRFITTKLIDFGFPKGAPNSEQEKTIAKLGRDIQVDLDAVKKKLGI